MDRGLDYAAKSIDPSAQLWRAGRRKRYDGIPVRRIESVSVYDHAFDDFTLRTSGVVSATLSGAAPFCISPVELGLWLSRAFRLRDERFYFPWIFKAVTRLCS